MKFDVIVGNPPYGDLHLPILKRCVQYLLANGISITVQPIRWLQDPTWQHKRTSDAIKMRPVLEGKLDSIKIISAVSATSIFNASFSFSLGIITVKNSGGNLPYTQLSKTTNGLDLTLLSRLISKNTLKTALYDGKILHFVPIKTLSGRGPGRGFVNAAELHNQYGYFVNGKSVNGEFGDGLSLEQSHKANKRRNCGRTIGAVIVPFNTAIQAKHFYNYIKLDVFRFFILATLVSVHVQHKFLPFPKEEDAFCTEWNSERFCRYFGITADELLYITEVMKDHALK